MAFILEKIPAEDIAAYGLTAINERLHVVGFGNGWVIDRERNIYLRWVRYNRETPSKDEFTFFWKGALVKLYLEGKTTEDGHAGTTTWSLAQSSVTLPPELEQFRDEFFKDLRDALTAYREYGMSSTLVEHTAKFDF